MIALLSSILILVVGVGICLFVGHRRPVGKPLTWGEAFVAGTFVFALLLVAYGVIPHQWLKYADNELLWRSDKLLLAISSKGVVWGQKAKNWGGSGRIIINYQAVRDIVASVFYGVFFAGQMVLWARWQRRGRAKPPAAEVSSVFGRPVIRKV